MKKAKKIHLKILPVIIWAILLPLSSLWAQDSDESDFQLSQEVITSHDLQVSLPEFVKELERMKAPTRFIKEALNNLNSIGFKTFPEGIFASYNKLTNRIDLSDSLRNPATGGLKPIADLTHDEIATVYHELWHCYLTRVGSPRNEELIRYFRQSANSTYPDHQIDFQDEAYAAFIDTSIASYIQMRRSMERLTPEKRESVRQRTGAGLTAIYETSFWSPIFGYYRSWTGKFITTTINLPHADRPVILKLLLDNQIPTAFAEAFAENKF